MYIAINVCILCMCIQCVGEHVTMVGPVNLICLLATAGVSVHQDGLELPAHKEVIYNTYFTHKHILCFSAL